MLSEGSRTNRGRLVCSVSRQDMTKEGVPIVLSDHLMN